MSFILSCYVARCRNSLTTHTSSRGLEHSAMTFVSLEQCPTSEKRPEELQPGGPFVSALSVVEFTHRLQLASLQACRPHSSRSSSQPQLSIRQRGLYSFRNTGTEPCHHCSNGICSLRQLSCTVSIMPGLVSLPCFAPAAAFRILCSMPSLAPSNGI